MKPCWNRSSPLPSQSGRQESNLPSTAYQTVAEPLGLGPNINALYGDRTRLTCSTDRLARQLHHRAKSVWRESNPPVRHGQPVPGPFGYRHVSEHEQQGRKESNPLRAGWSRIALPGARPCQGSCPGRTRTCNLPVNSGSHHRCATGQ